MDTLSYAFTAAANVPDRFSQSTAAGLHPIQIRHISLTVPLLIYVLPLLDLFLVVADHFVTLIGWGGIPADGDPPLNASDAPLDEDPKLFLR